jgi:hypothetical protein
LLPRGKAYGFALQSGALDEEKKDTFTWQEVKPHIHHLYAGSPFGRSGRFNFEPYAPGQPLMPGHDRNSKGVGKVLSPANVEDWPRLLGADSVD